MKIITGKKNPNWRGGGVISCPVCGKKTWVKPYKQKKGWIFCSKKCAYKGRKIDYSKTTGSNQWNWKGGISFLGKKLYKQIRKKRKYILWRRSVFERDKYTCQNCKEIGKKLNADHIKPFSKIVKENGLKNIKDMYKCKELWDINNGRTLCIKCHHDIGWRGSHIVK